MGKRTALAIGVIALLACVLATPASAVWTHKGKGELKENASVTLNGTVTLTTSAGNVACPAEIGGTLTASSSSGHVNSFTVSKASECDLTGSLAAICGTNGVTKVEKTGTWALTADETDITVSSIDLDYTLAGCLIPSVQVKGSSTASIDKATAIGTATLSKTQTLYNSLGEASGSAELKGTLSVTPAGTYGVKTAPLVETKWTDANERLSEDGKLTLSGTFSFSGGGGGISCPATVKLLLESSTVEEEEPEGSVESFTVSSPASCDVTGGYASTCGTNSISKVEQTGAATLTATEEDITISSLSLDYKFKECAITTLRVEGNPTVTVGTPKKISSATFSAGGLQIYNVEGEKTGTATAGGSTTASPSSTFQLTTLTPWTNTGNFNLEGTITSERGGLVTGPGVVDLSVTLANGEEGGEGTVTAGAMTGTVPTNIPGCHAAGTIAEGIEWPITLIKTDTIAIGTKAQPITFVNHYTETSGGTPGCFGVIPSTVPVQGIVTGTVENETGESEVCFNLNEYEDDLHVEGTGEANPTYDLTGVICVEGTEA